MEYHFAIRNFADSKVLNLPVRYLQAYTRTNGVNSNITFCVYGSVWTLLFVFAKPAEYKALYPQDGIQGISLKDYSWMPCLNICL